GLIASNTFKLNMSLTFPLILAVALGGALGSFITNKKINTQAIKLFTAILIAYVGFRLVLLHGWGWHI
ncbi:MAG: sulfite exporter TauE/SafE family protein, partial [Cyclobacteriaceae bacterium]